MRLQKKAIMLMVFCTFFTSAGQLFFKAGVERTNFSQIFTIINIPFILGGISYLLGLFLMLRSFKIGQLSVLYPILATSYVWVSVLAPIFFPEDSMNPFKWLGVGIILLSVSILGYGSAQQGEVGT